MLALLFLSNKGFFRLKNKFKVIKLTNCIKPLFKKGSQDVQAIQDQPGCHGSHDHRF
jgi:hypothetical protein